MKKLTDEQWCERCFELCEITMMLRDFPPRKAVIHSNPADYDLSDSEARDLKIKYLTRQKARLVKQLKELTIDMALEVENKMNMLGQVRYWYFELIYNDVLSKLEKINKNMLFMASPASNNRPRFNISQLKQVPIDQIVQVDARNKFKIRDERTPSCYWYKYDNTWVDFGGDNKKHDVIDLVMLVNHLDFIGACKYLSGV